MGTKSVKLHLCWRDEGLTFSGCDCFAKQTQCQDLRKNQERVALIHAFADGPYNRSSFHLAGDAKPVSYVAARIALKAIQGLEAMENPHDEDQARHPFAGMVDHVSVMPLVGTDNPTPAPHGHETAFQPATPSGQAARSIGRCLSNAGVQVFYYGTAHPDNTPLARVRREKTNFFDSVDKSAPLSSKGTATVGAPFAFVENFNVRLTSKCGFPLAKQLTKTLRERDGGLRGVEALTLPYSDGRHEIACNLLCPHEVSSKAIEAKTNEWAKNQMGTSSFRSMDDIIETAYRVGTTAKQCESVLELYDSPGKISEHDQRVSDLLSGYLLG